MSVSMVFHAAERIGLTVRTTSSATSVYNVFISCDTSAADVMFPLDNSLNALTTSIWTA
jgi:hypothetical protein